jgi:hypothetical protein
MLDDLSPFAIYLLIGNPGRMDVDERVGTLL